MNNNQFTITLENGSEQVCNFLFNFTDEDTNKNYIFFEIEVSGIIDVVEYIEVENKELELLPVTDEKTREMLSEVLTEFNNHECGCGCGCGCDEETEEEHTCCGGCNK